MIHIFILILSLAMGVILASSLSVGTQLLVGILMFWGVEGVGYFIRYKIASWHDRMDTYHRDARGKWLGSR